MLTSDEILQKCCTGGAFTDEDLGLKPIPKGCSLVLFCGEKTFYTPDCINYYDREGNPISEKDRRKYL